MGNHEAYKKYQAIFDELTAQGMSRAEAIAAIRNI